MESPLPATSLASLQTVGEARAELEARLMAIHNDLQLTQSIGLLFVKRQEDLRSCFEQLQELHGLDDNNTHSQQQQQHSLDSSSDSGSGTGSDAVTQQPLPEPIREQLAMMDKEFQEGQNGILGLKGLIDSQLPTIEVQPPQSDVAQRPGSNVLGPSALPSSALPAQTITKPRRHKVVVPSAPSINDPAFPVRIQEELLSQVRYWMSQAEMKEKLNQEYDTKITEMERIIDALNKQRRMREESDERQKEDQWNLELMNQELRTQNTELQQQLSRAVHENSKVQKALSAASEQLEQLKDKEERTAGQLELTKSRHEQDMTTMRKHTAGIQRDKSDLLKRMEELNATMAQQQQKLAKKATMEALALAQEREEEPESPVEPPILIQAPARLPSNDEIAPHAAAASSTEPKVASLARETSFAHQQSIISELQSKLSQEITVKEQLVALKEELMTEKEELVKMLADREETIETMRMEGTMGVFDPSVPHISDFSHPAQGSHETGMDISVHALDANLEGSRGLPLLRPASPMHAGGLFAELALAKSTVEPVATTVEYKDQEAMTEPIESWIHTIPGLIPASAPTLALALTAELASEAAPVHAAAATPDAERIVVETSTIATNTEAKTLADGITSTEDLHIPAMTEPEIVLAKTLADSATSTDDLPVAIAPAPAVIEAEVVPIKTLVDSTTSTDDLPAPAAATAKIMIDSTTSTDGIASSAAPSQEKPKALVVPALRNGPLTDIITGKSDTESKSIGSMDLHNVATPTVTGLEVASVRLPEILDQIEKIAQIKPTEPAFVQVQREEETMAPEEARVMNTLELETTEPVPRFVHSDVPLDDERRHTCDMSQSIAEMPSQSVPPVPALPKDIVQSTSGATVTPEDAQEFRVSFGSAFGDTNGATMITGRIEPVVSSEQLGARVTRGRERIAHHQHEHQQQLGEENERNQEQGHAYDQYNAQDQAHDRVQNEDEDEDDEKMMSPGRPTTGPPSTLLARAARASMASEFDSESLNEHLTTNYDNNSNSNDYATAGANHTDIVVQHPLNNSLPTSSPLAYPVRAASIRSSSLRSERRLDSSSPPPPHSRPPMSTGAAVISGTTRTAYTFNNSSSQVHMPQGQQFQQPLYQHITDSSGASIGRSRYRPSPNGSVSSMSTDYGGPHHDRRLSVSSNYDGAPTATDPTMIQIITQTMIGDYLWKYTRRPMASVISEKRHRRYFWVHPYTKTMYWSLNNPAADGSREQRAKSALIINVYQITDENPSGNSDLPNVSLLVQTSSRNLKLTAPTRQKHELWYQSLAYLLSRPTTPGADIASDNQTWSEVQATRGVTSDTLLTIKNDKSVRKKRSFNRLQNMFGRSKENSPSGSPRSTHATAVAPGSGLNSAMSSSVAATYAQAGGPGAAGGSNGAGAVSGGSIGSGGAPSVVNSVVGYPSHMMNVQSTVGGYGTLNGGPIMSQATSSLGTNTSPKTRLTEVHGFEDEYYDDGEEDDDEDDGELPEHVRQCCDGKHDIGALHHHQ